MTRPPSRPAMPAGPRVAPATVVLPRTGARSEPLGSSRLTKTSAGHPLGSPSPPRVVVIDSGQLDNVLALGVRPVGAADSPVPGRGFVRYLDTSGIASVGAVNDPDLDRIAALQPDLIVGARIRHVQLESSLVEIAPTLLSESVGGVWQDNLRAVATALSLSERAEQVLTA